MLLCSYAFSDHCPWSEKGVEMSEKAADRAEKERKGSKKVNT
jgi:hypothetical protein